MTDRYPHLFRGKSAQAEPPFRVTLSALPALEYDLVVHRWPLARLYVWMLAKHADDFNRTIQQAVREHRQSMSKN